MDTDGDGADFRALMDNVLAGDRAAADRLCRDYQSHILRVVRKHLYRAQRSAADSVDLVQDVWASFFREPPANRHFDQPNALAQYLYRMAENKVFELRRREVSPRHGYGGIEPLPDNAPAATPTPSQIVGAEDEWQHMLDGRPLAHQRILRLLRQGMSHKEIAARLQTNEKTIRRLVRRVQIASES